jgi:hypothetical protein
MWALPTDPIRKLRSTGSATAPGHAHCLQNLMTHKPEILLGYAFGKVPDHIKIEGDGNEESEVIIQLARAIVQQQIARRLPQNAVEDARPVELPSE